MAKEEEKEGRAVAKKDTRKRRSESNRKPDGSSNREGAKQKKKKEVEYVVSLGHSSKISDRHKGQLARLAALVTAKKMDLRATDNMQEILEGDASNAGVHMEWSKEKETYFIHARSRSRQLLTFDYIISLVALLNILLIYLGKCIGFEAVPEETEIKNPLLVFSEGFGNGGKWEDTKMLLFEVFGKPDANINCTNDYLYAFTRTSGKIYIRIYKINSLPSADKEGSVKQVFPTFVLKPVEIQCPDNIYYFLDVERFLMFQGDNSLTVRSSVSMGTIQHLGFLGQFNIMLPAPHDLSEWEGFNTNIAEYFNLFHAFKHSKVPGTGPESSPQFTMTFPEAKACYVTIKEKHIFLRGKTVRILGAGLTNYTLEKAVRNLNAVGRLLERLLMRMGLKKNDFPADLVGVLQLLKRDPFRDNGDQEKNPVKDYDIIKSNICWMDGEERNHVINDLLQDFLFRMGDYDQLAVGRPFPSFIQWVDMFDKENFLLRISRNHSLPKNKSQQELEKWYEAKRNELLEYVNHNKADADRLHSTREYFKSINNAIKHLLETSIKKDRLELSPDQVDLIGSSQFAAIYADVQMDVPKALAGVDPDDRGSYKRFARYFPSDDAIRFKQEDKK